MSSSHDHRVERVLEMITRDLTRRWSRGEAARVANMDPTYFSKRFRQVTGHNFAAWSARLRIEAARRLLSTTTLKISSVATAVGYVDPTTFSRVFRRIAAVSPQKFRETVNSIP